MNEKENMGQNAKSKKSKTPKRLGILIIPAGLLVIVLPVLCAIFFDPWYFVYWECLKEVMQQGGFLITMLINILWIANAFININNFLSKSYEDGKLLIKSCVMGIKHPLLNPPNKRLESHDYSFLFYELTVRFLVLVGLEIFVCYVFFTNRLSEVLALTLPMVTVFIVCSCFIASRNDKLVSYFEEQIERDMVKREVCNRINATFYPFRMYNLKRGIVFVPMDTMRVIIDDIDANLIRLEMQHPHGRIQLSFSDHSSCKTTYKSFSFPDNQMNFWDDIKRNNDKVRIYMVYNYRSTSFNKESEVVLVVDLSLTDNRFDIL